MIEEFILDPGDLDGIARYLGEPVLSAAKAGEGNMNCTVRVVTSRGTVILKQSRPWVVKYPQIPAPVDRTASEAAFYRETGADPELAPNLPRLLGFDRTAHVLTMQDVGPARDFTFLYEGHHATDMPHLETLTRFLVNLHGRYRAPALSGAFRNTSMRALNHEHIFALPLRKENGMDLDGLTPGLKTVASSLINDSEYAAQVTALGRRYLDEEHGCCLVHGDYFPGSWLLSGERVYVIDPEFCFFGLPEWDVAVMMAHLYLARFSEAEVRVLANVYLQSGALDLNLARQFAGVEIMRRLIGVAQLPLSRSLLEKEQLLNLSRFLVLERGEA